MKKKLPLIIAFVVAITAIVCTVVFLVTILSGDDNETETAENDNVTNLVDAEGDKEPDVDKEPEKNTDKNVDNETETESLNNQDVKYEDYNGTEVIVVSSENVEESKFLQQVIIVSIIANLLRTMFGVGIMVEMFRISMLPILGLIYLSKK